MANVSKKKNSKSQIKSGAKKQSRFFPVILAGFVCTVIAVSGGYGAWYFTGVKAKGAENREKLAAQVSSVFSANKPEAKVAEVEKSSEQVVLPIAQPTPTLIATPETAPEPTPSPEIAETEKKEETSVPETPIIKGVVFVKGGETTTGGDDKDKPLQRKFVDDFYIAETEVTNGQYAEFIIETKRKAPMAWNKQKFPTGAEEFPVTDVSFADVTAYCEWLSKKIGAEVRLPTEIEWERAAKGDENYKYPWGNEWDKKAVTTKGKVGSVKSFEKNKSAFGAYDMSGNVWEWTSETVLNSKGKPMYDKGQAQRLVKGGSAGDEAATLTTGESHAVPENFKDKIVGFRYVVVKPGV
jgi:toxoflavin biosynthesis protein ToxD